jgi:hypothetical protein
LTSTNIDKNLVTLFIFLHLPVRTGPLTYMAVCIREAPDPHHFQNLEPHKSSVIDLHHLDANPDSIYHPDADPDPSFQKKAQILEKVLK